VGECNLKYARNLLSVTELKRYLHIRKAGNTMRIEWDEDRSPDYETIGPSVGGSSWRNWKENP
jgi:hypothetical protein